MNCCNSELEDDRYFAGTTGRCILHMDRTALQTNQGERDDTGGSVWDDSAAAVRGGVHGALSDV